jgi:hypothetical protein
MAWIYLAESAESQRPWKATLNPPHTVKTTDTLKPCSCHEWRKENSLSRQLPTMFVHSAVVNFQLLTSSTAGSPAKTFLLQDAERAWQESVADYFSRSFAWLARYDPGSSSWKMCQLSVLGEETLLPESWPASGMTVDGRLYPLLPLERTTDESDGGFWLTPTVPNGGRSSGEMMTPAGQMPNGKKRQVGLEHQVRMVERQIWPTPTVVMSGMTTPIQTFLDRQKRLKARHGKKTGNGCGPDLAMAVKMFPTPRASDGNSPGVHGNGGQDLRATINQAHGGQLNPQWVEWLMGYPSEWTVLEDWVIRSFLRKPGRRSSASSESKKDKHGTVSPNKD